MCWFGGCFWPSCRTSISNVKGPHLSCVKIHREVVAACSLGRIRQLRNIRVVLALAVNSLEELHKYYKKNVSCSSRPRGSVGRRREAEQVLWAEVMCDGGRTRRKIVDAVFIFLRFVWCKQTQILCKRLISWTGNLSWWKTRKIRPHCREGDRAQQAKAHGKRYLVWDQEFQATKLTPPSDLIWYSLTLFSS